MDFNTGMEMSFLRDVGYRSYIRMQRKKWDIVYHGKDLYFSHANKILEPYYDINTKEYYGIETNPTRLAIIKFIDQFRDGPGIYEPEVFKDLLSESIYYGKRTRVPKPYLVDHTQHQSSSKSLAEARREERYRHQVTKPKVREIPSEKYPSQYSLIVENHPYEKMIGRTWTHIQVPFPPNYKVLDNSSILQLTQVCEDSHDLVIIEPVRASFYAQAVLRAFWWSKLVVKMMYASSIVYCCQRPHRWDRNLSQFLLTSVAHYTLKECLKRHPLGKYKWPDRFHDTESLNELKYFREFLPAILQHRVLVVFKDIEGQMSRPLRTLKILHLLNFLVVGYNYFFGMDHWYS
ncbi:unnamed protein product [Orchesella dallaii]|uniref:Uncharacterized protein n=1 Tax=Orchesella dallaii TaxID=48710 RepID=A0ABP1Q561_9HEXA